VDAKYYDPPKAPGVGFQRREESKEEGDPGQRHSVRRVFALGMALIGFIVLLLFGPELVDRILHGKPPAAAPQRTSGPKPPKAAPNIRWELLSQSILRDQDARRELPLNRHIG
jgi:hypothetical protein